MSTTTTTKTCECGCGQAVARRFAPGHDAKLKSALVSGLRSADWRIRHASANALAELGWTGHADPAVLRSVPFRTTRGSVALHVEDVQVWQVSGDWKHHATRTCSALTAWARATGQINRTTKLAADSALRFVANTAELAAELASSWDQCTECSTHATRDELGQRAEIAKRMAVAS